MGRRAVLADKNSTPGYVCTTSDGENMWIDAHTYAYTTTSAATQQPTLCPPKKRPQFVPPDTSRIPLVNKSTCWLLGRPVRPAIPFVYRPGPLINRSTCYSIGCRGLIIPGLASTAARSSG